LLGFSNGMWAVPMVAARRPDVAFVAGVGSPGVTMAESEVHRRTKVLRDAGVAAGTLTAVADAWRCVFAIAATAHAPEEITSRLTALLAELSSAPDLHRYQIPEFARNNPMLSPVPPAVPVTDLVAMIAGEPHPELAYDPADDYRRLRCPVFLQYGAEDTSVPAAASRERIAAALRESGDPRSAIHLYPNLEHQLNVIPAGVTGISPEEATYLFHCFRYGPGVKADLTTWLRNTIGSTSTR
jgi:pimeloyl-ACP methyl ester carboxylesterase